MSDKQAFVVVGLGFGDEGKGRTVDFLCKEHDIGLVVRHNGGDQAAHNVVNDTGRQHCFSQIGAGTFQGAKTLLVSSMLVNPISLAEEATALSQKQMHNVLEDHYISMYCPVITPYNVAANRIREYCRGKSRHGSCGRGVGEVQKLLADNNPGVPTIDCLCDQNYMEDCLQYWRETYQEELAYELEQLRMTEMLPDVIRRMVVLLDDEAEPVNIAQAYYDISTNLQIIDPGHEEELIRENNVVCEGAQGVLLDEVNGFHPYTTWSHCVPRNVTAIETYGHEVTYVGVSRAYATRHGEGPFVTRDGLLDGIYAHEHNKVNDWQGAFRLGWFDMVMLRYALSCCERAGQKIDRIALTHADVFDRHRMKYCNSYLMPLRMDPNILAESFDTPNAKHVLNFFPSQVFDEVYQSALTRALDRAMPEYEDVDNVFDLAEMIEKETDTPVGWISSGPRTSQMHETLTGAGVPL